MHITEPLPGDKRARLAFGLDWRAYAVKGASGERRRYADTSGATHYVEYKLGSELIAGFATPDMPEAKGARLFAGAVRVALHARVKARAAALVLLQDDQYVHAVYVVRGAVRSDEVLRPEDLPARRMEIEQECLKLNLDLTTLGFGDRIGDVDEAFRPSELLDNRKAGRIRKLPLAVPTLVPVALIVVGTVFGVSKAIDFFSPPPAPPHVETFQERYAAAERSAFARPQPLASALAPAILAALGKPDDVVMAGWVFRSAHCSASGRCMLTFTRNGGSFADFDRIAPVSMRPLSYARNGLTLDAQGPEAPKVASVSLRDRERWLSLQSLINAMQTPPQRLSAKPYEIEAYGYNVALDAPTPLIPIPPSDAHRTGQGAGRVERGTWTIQGYRWQTPLLARLPPNMTLESLDVDLRLNSGKGNASVQAAAGQENGVHFTAKGTYYVLD